MRTNIVLDDSLVTEAMKLSGKKLKKMSLILHCNIQSRAKPISYALLSALTSRIQVNLFHAK